MTREIVLRVLYNWQDDPGTKDCSGPSPTVPYQYESHDVFDHGFGWVWSGCLVIQIPREGAQTTAREMTTVPTVTETPSTLDSVKRTAADKHPTNSPAELEVNLKS